MSREDTPGKEAGGPDGVTALTARTTRAPRTLGFWSAAALIVASMMGTGVFTTSGFLLADLRSPGWVLAAWAVGGAVATAGALCYGALARAIPESGGEYLFLSRTLHPAAGCMAGWISVLVGFSAPLAAAAAALGEYTRDWWPGVAPVWTGTAVLMVLAAVHAWDVRRGATLQNVVVLLKVVLLLGLIVLGIPTLGLAVNERSDMTAVSAPVPVATLAMTLVWVSFSYSGWNAAVYLGGEVRDPERTLPRALLAGTLAVAGLYLAINAVFVLAVPAEKIAGKLEIGRIAAEHLGGPAWREVCTVLIVIALVTSVSSMVMAGPRVYAVMARDGYLPRILQEGSGPPRAAILLQLGLALGLLWTASYTGLLSFIGFTLNLSTAATVIGLMRWRRMSRLAAGAEGGVGVGGLPVPGWPWLPVAFVWVVLGMTALSVSRAPWASLSGLGVLAWGWGMWWMRRGLDRSGGERGRRADGAS